MSDKKNTLTTNGGCPVTHYEDTQSVGTLFDKVMTEQEQQNTINNTVGAMSGISGPKKDEIVNRQLCHWFRASAKLGLGIANGLGVDVSQFQDIV